MIQSKNLSKTDYYCLNQKWCTDFTYLFLANHEVRYNCTILDLYEFRTEEALYQAVEEFAYVNYNHVRPHSFNGYRTPYEARIAS